MDLHMRGNEGGEFDAVGVKERNEFSLDLIERLQPGAHLSVVLVQKKQGEARIVVDVARDHRAAVVGRAVVDHQTFEVGIVLPADRIDRGTDKAVKFQFTMTTETSGGLRPSSVQSTPSMVRAVARHSRRVSNTKAARARP